MLKAFKRLFFSAFDLRLVVFGLLLGALSIALTSLTISLVLNLFVEGQKSILPAVLRSPSLIWLVVFWLFSLFLSGFFTTFFTRYFREKKIFEALNFTLSRIVKIFWVFFVIFIFFFVLFIVEGFLLWVFSFVTFLFVIFLVLFFIFDVVVFIYLIFSFGILAIRDLKIRELFLESLEFVKKHFFVFAIYWLVSFVVLSVIYLFLFNILGFFLDFASVFNSFVLKQGSYTPFAGFIYVLVVGWYNYLLLSILPAYLVESF